MRRAATFPVMVVLALAAVASGAIAADDDMAMSASHPIVGAWLVDGSPDDPTDQPDVVVLSEGGTLAGVSSAGQQVGAWTSLGDRTARVTFHFPLTDPEGAFVGFGTVRSDVDVAEDGQSFSGTFTIEFPSEMAEAFQIPVGQLGPGEVGGQRIVTEAMGEPVAPWPLPPLLEE